MKKIICVLVLSLYLTGCGKFSSSEKLKVVVTIFPLYDFARNIGGERADVIMLMPPGVDPHSYRPDQKDMARMSGCDILVYNGSGLEPWLPGLLSSVDTAKITIINASDIAGKSIISGPGKAEIDEIVPEGVDPHIWLDFDIDVLVLNGILGAMCARDRENAEYYTANAGFYRIRLNQLDIKYRETLAKSNHRTIFYSGHSTFGYLARRYRLKQFSPYRNYSSFPEPSQRSIAGISLRAGNMGAAYIFCEELSDMKVARAITGESGMKILLLHGCHNVTQQEFDSGIDFITIMDGNLERLMTGLRYR